MAATKTYKLIEPIKPTSGDGPEITELVFHKPSLGDLRKHDIHEKDGQATKTAKILCAASGKPMPILDKISWEDYQKIQEEVLDFLGMSNESENN